MQAEMMALVERLVFAIERVSYNVENISQDVKNMSVSLQTLTQNVSHLLKEKNNAENANHSVATREDEQNAGIGSSYCEQDNVHSVSHTNELNIEYPPFAIMDVKSEVNSDEEVNCQLPNLHRTVGSYNEHLRDSVKLESDDSLGETQGGSYPSTSDLQAEPFISQYCEENVRGSLSLFPQSFSCGGGVRQYVKSRSEEREESLMENESECERSGVSENVTGTENHQKIPAGQCGKQKRPLLCDTCGKCCFGQADLERHHWVHTGAKPFACPMCEKAYRDKGNLRIHMRVHTGERPCKCSVCGKSFTQGNSLKCHMLTHTGEKPFNCTECGRAFSNKSSLAVHRRTHTGERPYSCLICGQLFAHSQGLSKHRRRFHQNS